MYSFDRHPAGFDVRLTKPLDFYAVTDHARFLGAVREAADPSTEFSRLPHVQALHNLNAPENMNLASMPLRAAAFANFLPDGPHRRGALERHLQDRLGGHRQRGGAVQRAGRVHHFRRVRVHDLLGRSRQPPSRCGQAAGHAVRHDLEVGTVGVDG